MLEIIMRTKKTQMWVTKWLGSVPLEAECTSCANAQFKVAHGDPRQPFHQPDRDRYRQLLQHQFDEHLKLVH